MVLFARVEASKTALLITIAAFMQIYFKPKIGHNASYFTTDKDLCTSQSSAL